MQGFELRNFRFLGLKLGSQVYGIDVEMFRVFSLEFKTSNGSSVVVLDLRVSGWNLELQLKQISQRRDRPKLYRSKQFRAPYVILAREYAPFLLVKHGTSLFSTNLTAKNPIPTFRSRTLKLYSTHSP